MNMAVAMRAAMGSMRKTRTGFQARSAMPVSTGTVVSKKILRTIPPKGNSIPAALVMNNCMEPSTTSGRVSTAAMLVTAVSEIDRATSPRARCVSSPELTPPGQAASTMRPTAMTGSRWSNHATPSPSKGTISS